ncbi:MAG: glutathione peroxidase [Acholeplasma sp.]|jgi:glutathione peroxidase|nr:MAG: glutathione peroxidase [Acholeplasma sp.]
MTFYDFKVQNTKGIDVSLDQYKGKVLLVINSATKCGLTPQYAGIEKLYQNYKDKGLEVLDFPCNQFLHQAPGTNEELKSFCQLYYGTTFETFAKIEVNGKNAHPLYVYLKKQQPKDFNDKSKQSLLSRLFPSTAIKWNFTKFLINREGKVIKRFGPGFLPEDIASYIEEVL